MPETACTLPRAVSTPPTGLRTATAPATDAARQRLALAQTALLSALVAGTPVPPGFDPRRLRAQSHALAVKRAGVVAKVAPELPRILGTEYRPAFLAYARTRPLRGGYRRDALAFVEHLLQLPDVPGGDGPARRRALTRWWAERSGPSPLRGGLARRALRRLRNAPARRRNQRRVVSSVE